MDMNVGTVEKNPTRSNLKQKIRICCSPLDVIHHSYWAFFSLLSYTCFFVVLSLLLQASTNSSLFFRPFLYRPTMPFGFPERLFPHAKYDSHRMRMFALAISWLSLVYNGIEGGVSIGLGADVASRALMVFGIQSLVEVL
jgi:hypothetical protein